MVHVLYPMEYRYLGDFSSQGNVVGDWYDLITKVTLGTLPANLLHTIWPGVHARFTSGSAELCSKNGTVSHEGGCENENESSKWQ